MGVPPPARPASASSRLSEMIIRAKTCAYRARYCRHINSLFHHQFASLPPALQWSDIFNLFLRTSCARALFPSPLLRACPGLCTHTGPGHFVKLTEDVHQAMLPPPPINDQTKPSSSQAKREISRNTKTVITAWLCL